MTHKLMSKRNVRDTACRFLKKYLKCMSNERKKREIVMRKFSAFPGSNF